MRLLAFSLLSFSVFAQDLTQLEGRSLRPIPEEPIRALAILLRSQYPAKPAPEQAALNTALLKAYSTRNLYDAYRLSSRLTILTQGEPWTEALEVVSSYQFRLGRRLLVTGRPLDLFAEPYFTLGRPLSGAYTLRFSLRDSAGRVVREAPAERASDFSDVRRTIDTANLPDGNYSAVLEILSPDNSAAGTASRPLVIRGDLATRLDRLARHVNGARLEVLTARTRLAVETAEYLYDQFDRATREYTGYVASTASPLASRIRLAQAVIGYVGEPFDYDADMPFAESLASAILDRKDPWRGRTGALRLAYRSSVDKSLQPFRFYIPPKFQAGKTNSLIVLLHGAGGDENTYFGPFAGDALFKRAAERRLFLVSPRGRGPVGGYVKDSGQDVLDVTRIVSEQFNIDPAQVFLAGHSMGANGAFSLGFNNPGVFRAIAPCAGVPNGASAETLLAKAPALPVFLTQGGLDTLVRPEPARRFAQLAGKTLTRFEYKEFPAADHFSVGEAAMPDTLDFFQSVVASTPKR